MSMSGGMPRGRADAVGETVATFTEYEGAQKAVSRLIASEVPARDIAIVGMGLRSIERITGRLGYATAARSGAINGLLLGLLFSAFLVLGAQSVPIQAFIGVMFVGIALGMLLSIVAYSFVRRRRDYASAMQVVADHYDVTVAASSIHKARSVLGVAGGAARTVVSRPPVASAPERSPQPDDAPSPPPQVPVAPPAETPRAAEPPRYGERVTPAGEQGAEAKSPGDEQAKPDEPDSSAPRD
jgi:pyruvate/2-oxoglutarate dehydrogenase complex dihydrolipoamide acyltransferase (E2) component